MCLSSYMTYVFPLLIIIHSLLGTHLSVEQLCFVVEDRKNQLMGKKEGKPLRPTFLNFKKRKEGKASSKSKVDQDVINMSEPEEDLIYRMYRLVGDRWDLIAGRIPGRTAEEIERYWTTKEHQGHNHQHLLGKIISHVQRT